MKKLMLVSGIFAAGFAFAQSASAKNVYYADGNLTNRNFAENQKSNVKSVKNLAEKVEITTREQNYDRISLADLNEQFGIPKKNPVYFDGNLYTDTSLKITGDSLKEMTAAEKDGKKYLFIYSEAQK